MINIINKLVHKYTQDLNPTVRNKVFTDNNVAFDEFIAYFLSKMREKDQLKTNISQLREKAKLSKIQLTEKLDVSEITKKVSKPTVPIIALTAKAMIDEREELLAYGFTDYISKPIDDEILIRVIEKYISRNA